MNWSQLQRPILCVPRVSLQRWVLTALALTAAVGATTFTSLAADHRSGVVLVLVIALALASVVNPDTHVATGTVVLVLWQWFVTTDDTTTPWTVPVAACLFVFHALVALMAVTPIGATVPVSPRWVVKSCASDSSLRTHAFRRSPPVPLTGAC